MALASQKMQFLAATAVLSLLRAAPPRMDITVCTGGTCGENGGDLLLGACSALASGNPAVTVRSAMCTGECPSDYAMLSPKAGKLDAYEASCATLDDALASAEKAISSAASFVLPGLKAAFVAYTEARQAEDAGDLATALEKYGAALKGAASVLDPCHEPLAAETLEWAGTVWAESLFASNLAVAGADFDQFGECGGGQALEEGKVVELPRVTLLKPTVDGVHASGRWEDDAGGGGAFELTMSDDGRAFAGTLSDADGGASRAWSGLRKPKPKPAARGRRRLPATRAVAPPSRARWLHESLLGRARCHLALGDADAAVDDATRATELCCREPSGFDALAEALDAAGDGGAADEARREAEYLRL